MVQSTNIFVICFALFAGAAVAISQVKKQELYESMMATLNLIEKHKEIDPNTYEIKSIYKVMAYRESYDVLANLHTLVNEQILEELKNAANSKTEAERKFFTDQFEGHDHSISNYQESHHSLSNDYEKIKNELIEGKGFGKQYLEHKSRATEEAVAYYNELEKSSINLLSLLKAAMEPLGESLTSARKSLAEVTKMVKNGKHLTKKETFKAKYDKLVSKLNVVKTDCSIF